MKILKWAGIAPMVTAVLIMENYGIPSLALILAGGVMFQTSKFIEAERSRKW